ncbi:MAG TPA: MFS transporter, partial [Acidimicrobiales bacterium]|nr:MFS transporter [Acidimicrobiales bacterium]
HTTVTTLTWTMVGPLLAYGLAAPVFGKAGDVFGHRRLYLIGLVGAMVSAVLTATAASVGMLLLARTLDGVQGAMTGTASGALINLAFAPEERVKAMGWWSLVGAGGPVIGVSLGSPVIAAFGWRALFWLQLGLLVAALAVVAVLVPRPSGERPARRPGTMDWAGSGALSVGVTALMLALSIGPSLGWAAPGTLVAFVASAVMVALFAWRTRVAAHPFIPAHYFTRRNFVTPMVLRACGNFAYFGAFFLFPLLMEQGYGYSIPRVGALAVARPITFALCSPIAGYVAIRVGERVSSIAGAAALTGSLALFALLTPASGVWVIAVALALSGLGMGVIGPSSSSVMANEVESGEFGVIAAAQLLAMQVGEVAGIEVLETVRQALVRSRHLGHAGPGASLLSTFRTPFALGAAVAGAGLVASLFVRSVPRPSRRASRAR